MANRKKAKEEKPTKSKVSEVASNMENVDWAENVLKETENSSEGPSLADCEKDKPEQPAQTAAEKLEEELKDAWECEQFMKLHSIQEEEPKPETEKPKLHLLADDRLNSLINTANEMGITDVVQILNSEKYGQFYLVYRS